jgi:squalene-associated FAD-dependent desaturase
MSPRHVVIIGGGFAGLSCAVSLCARGLRTTVLEARRSAGGRAGSFLHESGEIVDNGQHLFMACYTETRKFLSLIGTSDRLRFQEGLSVTYLSPGGRRRLHCPPVAAPFHLLAGTLAMKGLSFSDRIAVLRAIPALRRLRGPRDCAALERLTVTEWLDQLGQTENLRRWLWHPLTIATLNQAPDLAPASLLARVLHEAFMGDRNGASLGISRVGLSDLYTSAAAEYLARRGSELRTESPVVRLMTSGGRVSAVETRDGEIIAADAFVSSVPPRALDRLGVPVEGLDRFATSPILSVNLWIDRPLAEVADFDFAGIIDCRIQWLFNKERIFGGKARHLSAVISAASDFVGQDSETLSAMAWEDTRRCLPAARRAKLLRSLVVRERTATISATVETEPLRPGMTSPYVNLLLAGDWTERGLPATIETAVRTGHRCADRIVTAGTDRPLSEPVIS